MDKLNDQELVRLEKLREIRNLGFSPFLTDRTIDIELGIVREKYQDIDREQLEEMRVHHQVAGRIMSIRSRFVVIRQANVLLQLYLSDELEENEKRLAKLLDIGDII